MCRFATVAKNSALHRRHFLRWVRSAKRSASNMSAPHGTKGEGDRLGFIEAERINAVLEDTTEKLAFLDRLDTPVLDARDSYR
jgi:hypothetical protein